MSGERRRGMWANTEKTQTHPSTHIDTHSGRRLSVIIFVINQLLTSLLPVMRSYIILTPVIYPVITGVYLAAQTSRLAVPAVLYCLLKGTHESTKHPAHPVQ